MLEAVLPDGFTPFFLLGLILGMNPGNAPRADSAGLVPQAVGLRVRRSISVIVDGVAAIRLARYGLLPASFLDTAGNVLRLTVVLLRRTRCDGLALTDETPGGSHWFSADGDVAGALAHTTGTAAAALRVNTFYTRPIVGALDGVYRALPVGMVVAASSTPR
ncbi:hypothetical protein [Streptomyces sp. NPDC002853]